MTEFLNNDNVHEELQENLKELINSTEPVETEQEPETKSFASDENEAAKLDVADLDAMVHAAAAYGYAKKAREIVGVDLRGISPVADYFLILSGSNKPQIRAICDNIEEKLAEQGVKPLRIEGYRDAEWVLLDYGNLIVHIFDDEQRAYYNLEHLWGDAPAYRFTPAE